MYARAVSWRRAVLGLGAVAVATTATVAALRSDGFTAVDATVPRATRWFVNRDAGWVTLADGFSGQSLARVAVGEPGDVLEVAQSSNQAVVLDRGSGMMRSIDWATFDVGSAQTLGLSLEGDTVVRVGQPGVVAVDPATAEAVVVPPDGDRVYYSVGERAAAEQVEIAPDGAVWTVGGGRFARYTTGNPEVFAAALDNAALSLVGNVGIVYDRDTNRVRLGAGAWVELPGDIEPTEVVLQEPSPTESCGWLASGDRLWCVGSEGIERESEVPGLGAGASDFLAVAGDAAVIVDRAPSAIVRFDWRTGEIFTSSQAFASPGASFDIATATDLIWVDEAQGDNIWAISPWGINRILKSDESPPLLGDSGEVLDAGTGGTGGGTGDPNGQGSELPPPDNNGFDDYPIANDDPVTARTGASVSIPVTANDYDPDGEGIALVRVDPPASGAAEIVSATTAVYYPEPGFVGTDEFTYWITDAAGHEASAIVTITLLPVDAPNNAPRGTSDHATTSADNHVIIDVLLNDVDPERDPLRIGSFTTPEIGGEVFEDESLTGLPALRYEPPRGVSGEASFTYRPVDTFGAQGDPVVVTVEIAQPSDANRAPIVRPDSVRVRRDIPVDVPVLANDRDPDGDDLTVSLITPLPRGIEATVSGNKIQVTARAGSPERAKFGYEVEDTAGNSEAGSVLVLVVGAAEPNRPPVAAADTATAVIGKPLLIDVLRNDSDPDNDPLILVSATPNESAPSAGAVRVQGDKVMYTPPARASDDRVDDRFTYVISDGNGHTAEGTVAVRVLSEPIEAPPFARDDSATTLVNVPVTIDVLRNDGDPSGERPALVGTPGCAGEGTAVRTQDNRVEFTPPLDRSGVFRCTYEVVNSQNLSAFASIVVTVLEPPVNAPPLVVDEIETLVVSTSREFDVLANDSDPDGPHEQLRLVSSSTPVAGKATRSGSSITYEAPPTPTNVTITYQVADADGGLSHGRLIIRVVRPEPAAPIAEDDLFVFPGPATAQSLAVLANDVDPDGNSNQLRVQTANLQLGAASVSRGETTVRIAPSADFVGDVVATYTVVDADGLTDTATVTMRILPPRNRAPIANPDFGEVVNGGTVSVPLGQNDSDPDGDQLSFQIISGPDSALGTATLSGSTLTFSSRPGAPSGVAEIAYRISDGQLTADSTARIAVQACTVAPPNAPDLFFETGYRQPISIDLTRHASNGTIVDVGAPLGAPTGIYTPPAGENGNITFGYSVRNSCSVVDRGTVTIDVNQPPLASAVALSIGRFEQVTLPVSSLASDDEALAITSVPGQPEWVTVSGDRQSLQINPAGRTGSAAFTVVVSDPGGLTAQLPVTIELLNRAPIGQPDSARSADASPVDVNVLGNDADPEGDAIVIRAFPAQITFPNGAVGSVEAVGGALRVSPGSGAGTVTFEYTIADSFGAVSAPIPVTFTVNGAPVASNTSVAIPYNGSADVAVPVSDPDGDPLVVSVPSEDPYGLDVQASGTVIRVQHRGFLLANGPFEVPYTVTDPSGRTASAVLTVTITTPPTTTTTTLPPTTTTLPPTTTTVPPPGTAPVVTPPPGPPGPPGSGPPGPPGP